MQINVLVVEDNPSLNTSLTTMLKKEGYHAYSALNESEAQAILAKTAPHIVLLDIMLPDGSGFDLVPMFRQRKDCRILMLTALDSDSSKRIAYETGADDYITKPFDLGELIYKLNSIKRRILSEHRKCSIGDISFEIDQNRLVCGERVCMIQPSQIKLLKRLLEKYEEHDYLKKCEVSECTCFEIDESQRIQTLVARLRKSLVEVGSKQVSIETIYGKGYKLAVDAQRGSRND